MTRFRLLLVSSLALAACNDVTAPGPLQVSVSTSRATMTPGDTARITVTIRNASTKPVTFDINCAVDVKVVAVGDKTDVTRRRTRICREMYMPKTLDPAESFEQTFVFDATATTCMPGTCYPDPFVAGDYLIKGVLFYEQGPVVSDPVPLEIR